MDIKSELECKLALGRESLGIVVRLSEGKMAGLRKEVDGVRVEGEEAWGVKEGELVRVKGELVRVREEMVGVRGVLGEVRGESEGRGKEVERLGKEVRDAGRVGEEVRERGREADGRVKAMEVKEAQLVKDNAELLGRVDGLAVENRALLEQLEAWEKARVEESAM